ncbi:MAG: hypothetical protein ACXWDI_00115 [Nocardioides sp.]
MSDDKVRTRVETLEEPVSRALAHARRAELWAGLNRYTGDNAAGGRGNDARDGEGRSAQLHHE